jgi:hypothetical protein
VALNAIFIGLSSNIPLKLQTIIPPLAVGTLLNVWDDFKVKSR